VAITQDGWFNDTLIKALGNDIALDLGDTTPGTFKGALFQSGLTPNFSQSNPAYNSSPYNANEASGPGYTAGGLSMTVLSLGEVSGTANKVGWALDDIEWTGATIEAAGLLIYVPALSSRAVLLRFFGQSYSSQDGVYSLSFAADGVWRHVTRSTA
jgi:hypothetical protein